MKDNLDYIYIRKLLSRWYDAETTRDEEAELIHILSSAENLPPDLEKDKALLLSLGSSDDIYPEIPIEFSKRISDAIEKEISSATDKKRKRFSGLFNRGRLAWAAAIGAIIVLGSVMTIKIIDSDDIGRFDGKHVITVAPSEQKRDTIIRNNKLILSSNAGKHIAYAAATGLDSRAGSAKANRSGIIEKRKSDNENVTTGDYSNSDDEYILTEEEERMAKSHYRVIRTEEEADALLNSIYSKLESNLERETSKISRYELEYESSMVKLSEINNVTLLKEKYHEKTPL